MLLNFLELRDKGRIYAHVLNEVFISINNGPARGVDRFCLSLVWFHNRCKVEGHLSAGGRRPFADSVFLDLHLFPNTLTTKGSDT